MLCGDGQSSRIMYNSLVSYADVIGVIIENKPSAKQLLQRRIKKLGYIKVSGQVLFLLLNKWLAKFAQARIARLVADFNLNDKCFPDNSITKVDSVNSEETISLLKKFNPDAVIVNGTRIISEQVLSSIKAPFINTHMGITPKYRGVHGGYWALAKGDRENCGVTVHLVDRGIDTGGVLYQAVIQAEQTDNFNTYPIHQIYKAIPLMKLALNDVQQNKVNTKEGVLPSGLWYHPTLYEYLKYWLQKGVR